MTGQVLRRGGGFRNIQRLLQDSMKALNRPGSETGILLRVQEGGTRVRSSLKPAAHSPSGFPKRSVEDRAGVSLNLEKKPGRGSTWCCWLCGASWETRPGRRGTNSASNKRRGQNPVPAALQCSSDQAANALRAELVSLDHDGSHTALAPNHAPRGDQFQRALVVEQRRPV
jgi:hypothetical protein